MLLIIQCTFTLSIYIKEANTLRLILHCSDIPDRDLILISIATVMKGNERK